MPKVIDSLLGLRLPEAKGRQGLATIDKGILGLLWKYRNKESGGKYAVEWRKICDLYSSSSVTKVQNKQCKELLEVFLQISRVPRARFCLSARRL